MTSSPTLGQIITFYSYKGGTGRTMALANIACLLGQDRPDLGEEAPPRVLALDWDFEAPGLHRYLRPYLNDSAASRFDTAPGCLELFSGFDARRGEFDPDDFVANRDRAAQMLREIGFAQYLLSTRIPGLAFMKAGRMDESYARRVGEFKWDRLFRETLGLFPGVADFLRQRFDYILVDSRTGMSDTSGICTMLLPDKLVVVFTPNQQSLTGIGELARKAVTYRKASPDARPVMVFPLPSRLEMARPSLLDAWRLGGAKVPVPGLPPDLTGYQPLFEGLFDEIYARSGTRLAEYFDAVMLQHIPDYAYGEPVAVMLEETDSRISLRSSYAAFKERLTELQAPWESPAQVRLEREIARRCEEARAKAAEGDVETALRLAYGLYERKPPASLFRPVARAILDVARAAYPHLRGGVSAMLNQAASLAAEQPDLDPIQVADILLDAGKLCLEAGDYPLARSLLMRSRQLFSDHLGEEHPAILTAGRKLVEAMQGGGEWAETRREAEQVLETSRRVLGEEHPDTLTIMNNLANTLRARSDLSGARALQEKVLEARRRVLGEEHLDVLGSMNDLALTLSGQGDLAGARGLQERVLEARRRQLGEEHRDTLTSMNNLALTLRALGDMTEALALQERVLEAIRRVLGEEHPDTLTSMNDLAGTLRAQGDLAEARTIQERVLETRRRVLGEEHPAILTSMNDLAETLRAQGELAGARELHERVLEARRRLLGEEHRDTLTSMNNLALTLRALGDMAEARALQERVLEAIRGVLGEEHPDTLTSMNNLAHTLWAQGDLAGARAFEERVLETRRRALGEEHPATLTSMNNLAETLRAQGDLAGARGLHEQELAICRRVLGEEHTATLTSMNNLAETLRAQGDPAGARALQERVLEARRRVLGEEHPDTLTSMSNLAGTLQDQLDLAGARALQEQVLEARRRLLGEKHPSTQSALVQLYLNVQQQGDLEAMSALMPALMKSVGTTR